MVYILNSLGSSLKLNDCNYIPSQKLMYFIIIKASMDLSRSKIDRWFLAPCTPECNFIGVIKLNEVIGVGSNSV